MRALHRDSRRSVEPSLGALGRQKTRVRYSHIFGENGLMHLLLGFLIALAVGLTGIGGGSFTVPALLLIVGMPAGEAVGTAFVFAGVLRLIAAPFYLFRRNVNARYFQLMLKCAIPGLVLGIIALRAVAHTNNSPLVVIILGLILTLTASLSFVPK